MAFTINYRDFNDDLVALSRGAGKFLEGHSSQRLSDLSDRMRNGVLNAKNSGPVEFSWRTLDDQEIILRPSKSWKGDTDETHPLVAAIKFDYKCMYIPSTDRVAMSGVAVVEFKDIAKGSAKVVHFDAERGGWEEAVVGGPPKMRSAHPPFHAQFYGAINDIPRMPSIVFHPVDVLTFSLLDLHQKHWRVHSVSTKGKSELRLIPVRQKVRLHAIIDGWKAMMVDDGLPMMSMQRALIQPIAL